MFAPVSRCVTSFGAGRCPCPGEGFRAVFGQIFGGFSGSAEDRNRAPAEAQRSGFGGKRRRSGMSKFSPLSAETRDMELAPTRSRRKALALFCANAGHGSPQCGLPRGFATF